jgi:CDP-diglyceride synthetase
MRKRIIVSSLFIPVIVAAVYFRFLHSIFLFLFVLLLSIFAAKELSEINRLIFQSSGQAYHSLFLWALPGAGVICYYYAQSFLQFGNVVSAIVTVLPLVFFFFFALRKPLTGKPAGSFLLYGAHYVYTALFPLIIFIMRQEKRGVFHIFLLFFLAWFNDAAAYFIGSFFGRTRGIVKYSPNKSLEGYAGAFVLTILLAAALRGIFGGRFPFDWTQTVIVGVLFAVFAPVGDLVESVLKRRVGKKDSSHLVPGLGGALDIFDSILMSVPFYYILVKYVFGK